MVTNGQLQNYLVRWEVYQTTEEKNEGVRIEAEEVITKDLLMRDLTNKEIATVTHNFIDNCHGLVQFLQIVVGYRDPSTTVDLLPVSAGLKMMFTYQTPFKVFSFELLLERQSVETETRFEQVARSLHQQLVAAQLAIEALQEDYSKLKEENQKLMKEQSPTERRIAQTKEWQSLGSKESLFSMISYLLQNSASHGLRPNASIRLLSSNEVSNSWFWKAYPERDWCSNTTFHGINQSGAVQEIVARDGIWPFLLDDSERAEFIKEAEEMGLIVKWQHATMTVCLK